LAPGPNPATSIYNARVVKIYNVSVVKIYNATNSLARLKAKKISSPLKNALAYDNAGVVAVNSKCRIGSRDRCYDFRNIFAEKNCEKIGVF
jgi:hypothetical protein